MTHTAPLAAAGNLARPATTPLDLATEDPAIAHCMEVYHRTNRAELAKGTDRIIALERAAKAYRRSMPGLTDRDRVRDFIACAAHGLLIGAITSKESIALLYAAQIALNGLRPPHPLTQENP